jgi:hypothetical protein
MVFMGVIFAFLDPNPQRYSKLGDFFVYVLYPTRLHLLPLRFHCVGRGCCWDRTQDRVATFGIGCIRR